MGEDKKAKKGKKLALNKETVQELNDEQLEGAAGGALKTGGGHCKEQSLYPACPGTNSCTCAGCNFQTITCNATCVCIG
ncbi:MAG TPA: class I lanthipeptide [Kouleothrix sp.]|jgi:hypothetical protein|uniref:class I lanthipeptide n=1 Tax=Kouleothrix sp. TaxID=2779161 RepID=UPI002CF15007|nr:class I lanthipeptide [Kouleothrix sp.]